MKICKIFMTVFYTESDTHSRNDYSLGRDYTIHVDLSRTQVIIVGI